MASPGLPVITLLTDFGTADYFAGAVRGAILSVNPLAVIVDITHDIPPQDIEAGAFTLLASYESFPQRTIHVAVIDPGVGSTRRAVIVSAGGQFFVGPDNGIFSYIFETEPAHQTFHVTAEKYFRNPPSATFHGRDIFAPVAAALSKGVAPEAFGPAIRDEVRFAESLEPLVKADGTVKGRIIHIDRFGNCITNITRKALRNEKEKGARLLVKRRVIRVFRKFFSENVGAPDVLFAIWGSAGFLEIAANNRSAAAILNLRRGEAVTLAGC